MVLHNTLQVIDKHLPSIHDSRKGYAMSLFSKVLSALGFDKPKVGAPPKEKPRVPRSVAEDSAARARRVERIKAMRAARAKEIPLVDVMAKLEEMAAANPQELNWKVSIVDLLKLLEIDSSIEARKELALELRCPAEMMEDSAQMNTWLHKTVLEKIADNGGNIPMELLD
jgi:hypothetical protein